MAATALAAVIEDAYIQNIGTCAVDDLVEALGKRGPSMGRLCRPIQTWSPSKGFEHTMPPAPSGPGNVSNKDQGR